MSGKAGKGKSGKGYGDWGLGIGDWAQSPIPNPQSPIPNPHLIKFLYVLFNKIGERKLICFLIITNL